MNFQISKNATITDNFKCIAYPDLSPITYKFCISRQLTKAPGGEYLYPECITCETGQAISKHFKSYSHTNKVIKNPVTLPSKKKKKRAKKGESPYSRYYIGKPDCKSSQVSTGNLAGRSDAKIIGGIVGKITEPENFKQTLYDLELLIKAQITYIFQLVHEGKLKAAIKRIKLLNEEIGGIYG